MLTHETSEACGSAREGVPGALNVRGNILLIHQYYLEKDSGGGSRFNQMTQYWAERGHKTTVLSGMVGYSSGKKEPKYKGRFYYKDDFAKNITVHRCHVSEAYNVNFVGRLWGYISFVFSSIVIGLAKIKGKEVDVIVCSSPPLFVGITAMVLSVFKRSPYIFEIRDLWPESAVAGDVIRSKVLIQTAYKLERLIYKRAKLISVLTPAFEKALVAKKGVRKERIVYLPNACDFDLADNTVAQYDRNQLRAKFNFDGKFVIIYVGAHGRVNDLMQLLRGAERMDDRRVLFVLVGDGMERPRLKSYAEEKRLSNVRFVNTVSKEEVFQYIHAADVGCSVLLKRDTFKTIYSNKTFDYMSCKKPVLMVIDGISKELVSDAGCGVCCRPDDTQDLIDGIRVLMDHSSREKLGENGHVYCKPRFDRKVIAENYLSAIDRVIAEHVQEPN